jgi:NADPH-dependent F420 reductase
MSISPTLKTIAVIGGTGKEGKGLAYRWAKAGYRVLIGSRTPEKAQIVAKDLIDLLGGKAVVEGLDLLTAAQRADIVVLAVPYSAHRNTLETIKRMLEGKILIDVTVPLVPSKITKVQMPPSGSATQEAHEILGAGVQVTSAFQNISYQHLLKDGPVECDVLVTGTTREARSETLVLVKAAGLTGWDAGPIENSVVVEGMTNILIGINQQYASTSAGFRIIGVQTRTQEL